MIENLALLKRTKLFYGITENEMGAMLECLSAAKHSYQRVIMYFEEANALLPSLCCWKGVSTSRRWIIGGIKAF